MKREPLSSITNRYCCEDHFDIEQDLINYWEFKLGGANPRLKPEVVPHKFACQESESSRAAERPYAATKKMEALKWREAQQQSDESIPSTSVQKPVENVELHEFYDEQSETENKSIQIQECQQEEPMDNDSKTDLVDYKTTAYKYEEVEEKFDSYEPNLVDHSKVFEDLSRNECDTEHIKCENDVDILYEDIKCEIDDGKSSEYYRLCEVCNKSFSSGTDFIKSENNKFECSCHHQHYSVIHNQQDEDMTLDYGLQPFKVKDEIISDDYASIEQFSSAASQKDSVPPSKIENKLPHAYIADDLLLSVSECTSIPVDNDLFIKHQIPDTAGKNLQCKFCSKPFVEKIDLKVHERMVHSRKTFDCKLCSKSFTHAGVFKRHEMMHEKQKTTCKVCSKVFFSNKTFKIHEKTHTEVKSFYCKVCKKYFRQMASLRAHDRIHSGDIPFHCETCSKSFLKNSQLMAHESIHTGVKPFHCKICSKSFRISKYLQAHEKKRHFNAISAQKLILTSQI